MGTDEDIYAARIGRKMWRIAKRRAREARLSRLATARIDHPAGRISTSDNKTGSPALRRAQERKAAAGPNTLAEFLRELAAELGKDDPDPDAS